MKSLSGAIAIVMLAASHASAEVLEFTCNTSDKSSEVLIRIGDGADGFPLEGYTIDGIDKSDSIVQYTFQFNKDTLFNIINIVDKTPKGRVHNSSSIKMTGYGLILESVRFNVDSENIEATAVQSLYECELPERDAEE